MQDLYITNWLIQNTEKSNIRWRYHEGNWQYTAKIESGGEIIELKMGSIMQRTGSRIIIELSTESMGKVHIQEPHMSVSFRRRYDTEDDKELAEALKRLLCVIKRLHTDKELQDTENKEARKQVIFKKLLGMS